MTLYRLLFITAALFCTFKLGELSGEARYYKRIQQCVTKVEAIDMKSFYGHGIEYNLYEHAKAYNSNIYIDCIFKDLE